jgi:integrase
MPRKIPSYRLHKPSGQAVVTLNGRDFYLGEWNSAKSRAEFDRLLAEWLSNGHQLPPTPGSRDLAIVELLAAYLCYAKQYYADEGKPTSEYACMKDAVRPLRELYSRTSVHDFGPLALKAVRQRMIQSGLCRTHINHRVNRIRRVFKWGVENELVPAAVLHALQAVAPLKQGRTAAPESKPVRPVPDEHVDAILPHVARQVAAMIRLQRLTGMRPGEVVIMRPCDVERSGDVWVYRPVKHKTKYRGHVREVYLGPRAQEILRTWLDRDPAAFCFSPAEAEAERNAARRRNRKTPVTPSQAKRRPKAKPKRAKRDRYDRNSYRRAIEYAIKKSGTPHWHPHQLRHSCGTRLRRDYGLDVAQVILGHKTASVTEIYAEADRAKALAVTAKSG